MGITIVILKLKDKFFTDRLIKLKLNLSILIFLILEKKQY